MTDYLKENLASDISGLINKLDRGTITKNLTVHILKKMLRDLDVQVEKGNGQFLTFSTKQPKQEIITFDWFWETYGKKKDTAKCKDKFNKLTEEEARLIKETLPDYVKSTPDVQFRKNPLTYLNGKCWLDEIIKPKNVEGVVLRRDF